MIKEVPKNLYRYTVLKPEFMESYERIFSQNEIYAPLVSDLNDPYDCIRPLKMDGEEHELIEHMKKLYEKRDQNYSDIELLIERMGIKNYLLYNYYNQLIKQFKLNRLLCFSEACDNYSMWYNYADNFQGFCLEIVPDEEMRKWLLPVKYSDDLRYFEPIKLFSSGFDSKTLINQKQEIWSHEKEWRIFVHRRMKTEYVKLPQGSIKAVIFGSKIKNSIKDLVEGWIKTYNNKILIRTFAINY